MRVLVTGATGFIGKELLRELANNPEIELTAISRNQEPKSIAVKNVNWLRGDLSDTSFVETLSETTYDKIYHLAWQGLPNRSAQYSRLNLAISKNFLLSVSKNEKTELNIVGSCLEYGSTTGMLASDTPTIGNDDFSKAKIELHSFVRDLNRKYRWYRPFYVYGKNQNPSSLIPVILQSLQNRKTVEIRTLNNSHDFIAVEDVASVIYLTSMTNTDSGEINIGTGVLTCVGDIVKGLHSLYGVNYQQSYLASPGLFVDPKVLQSSIGWKPTFSGIDGILDYFKSSHSK